MLVMVFRRLSALCMFMTLLFAQVATAHHSAVHLDHAISVVSYSSEIESDHEQDHQKTLRHVCPECLLSKSLNVALSVTDVSDAYISFETLETSIENDTVYAAYLTKYTHARAPPSFLI